MIIVKLWGINNELETVLTDLSLLFALFTSTADLGRQDGTEDPEYD